MQKYAFWPKRNEFGWTFCSLEGYSMVFICASCTISASANVQPAHMQPQILNSYKTPIESTMNVFDGSFVKRMYMPYSGAHTNLAAECKILPE